ncbi:hypothetical protein PPH41_40815, partial [Burkholderia gladioli]|nr:hypothetical protein [Burkholderia gladioli]
MLGVAPQALELADHESGRVTLGSPATAEPLEIAVAYAGIWILIGVSTQPLGLATAFSVGEAVDRDEQHRIRLASVAHAAGTLSAAGYLSQPLEEHAHRVHTHDAGSWRVLDLPMPGRQCVAALAAREMREAWCVIYRRAPGVATSSRLAWQAPDSKFVNDGKRLSMRRRERRMRGRAHDRASSRDGASET